MRIPSVSDVDGDAPEVRRSAEAVARILGEADFAEVEILQEGGRPAVVARHPAEAGSDRIAAKGEQGAWEPLGRRWA